MARPAVPVAGVRPGHARPGLLLSRSLPCAVTKPPFQRPPALNRPVVRGWLPVVECPGVARKIGHTPAPASGRAWSGHLARAPWRAAAPMNFGRILGTFRVLRVLAAGRTELPTCLSPAGVRPRRSTQPVAARALSRPLRRRRLRKRDAAYLWQCRRRPHRGA